MPENIHATALVVGDRGIVIVGASGAGKTQLALSLIDMIASRGGFARLVADDQLFLSVVGGRLLCAAPGTISGLAEVRGVGPTAMPHVARAPVDLLVRLVGREAAPRYPDAVGEQLLGVDIPVMTLAGGDVQGAVFAVLARLSLAPFG